MRRFSFAVIEAAIHDADYIGFCMTCGHEQSGVEPDAEGYECEACGCLGKSHGVYGSEQILIMGLCDDENGKEVGL